MTRHELKTWPEMFDAIRDGRKTFEVRKNDRGFQTGDLLVLRKWNPRTEVYGDHVEPPSVSAPLHRRVTYVLSGFGIEPGYVVMGLGAAEAIGSGEVEKGPGAAGVLDWDSKPEGVVAATQVHGATERFKSMLSGLLAQDLVPEDVKARCSKELKDLWCKIPEDGRDELEEWYIQSILDRNENWVWKIRGWMSAIGPDEGAKLDPNDKMIAWYRRLEGALLTVRDIDDCSTNRQAMADMLLEKMEALWWEIDPVDREEFERPMSVWKHGLAG